MKGIGHRVEFPNDDAILPFPVSPAPPLGPKPQQKLQHGTPKKENYCFPKVKPNLLGQDKTSNKSYIYNLKLLNTSTTHGRMVRATMPRRTIRGVNVVSDHA